MGAGTLRRRGRRTLPPVLVLAMVVLGLSAVSGASPASTPRTVPHQTLGALDAGSAVYPFGGAPVLGSLTGTSVNSPVVRVTSTPDGGGYWLLAADGGVFTFGDALFEGSLGATTLNAPVVGMAATPDGHGYWMVGADGGVFTFGDATFDGSLGATELVAPIVGMAATPDGQGYWLVGADGGVFSFGDATFEGSLGGLALAAPIRALAATPDGHGYWMVGADGGVFCFGDARFEGSLGSTVLAAPVVGITPTADGQGYWLAAADGGVFTFGDAPFGGSLGGQPLAQPVVGLARSRTGYWLAEGQLPSSPFTPSLVAALDSAPGEVTAAVEDLDTGDIYTFHPGLALDTASIVKVQFLATALAEAQAAGRGLTPYEQGLAAPMIEASDNTAATALLADVGGPGPVAAFDQSIGMTGSDPVDTGTQPDLAWIDSTTTATDQLILLHHLVAPNGALSDASRAYALSLMSQIIPADVFGLSAGVPPGLLRVSKTGRVPSQGVINGIGWVQGQGRNYLIAVLTQGEPDPDQTGLAEMDEVSSAAWDALGP